MRTCSLLWAMAAIVMRSSGFCLVLDSASAMRQGVALRRNCIRRSLTTNIFIVGKRSVADEWIGLGYSEYEKRLSHSLKLQTVFVKTDEDLIKAARSSKGMVIALDETGRTLASTEFSDYLFKGFEKHGAHVDFIIGGHAGLPTELRSTLPLISLSKMTWPHQLARLLLVEQIYRSFEIKKGTVYHR